MQAAKSSNLRISLLAVLATLVANCFAADYVHNPIAYHSQTDRGAYNYGYDTGLYGSHQFHQESKDASGQVNGRYGYTDPNGKLRLVYYTAGKDTGFQIVKDVDASSNEAPSLPLISKCFPPHNPFAPLLTYHCLY